MSDSSGVGTIVAACVTGIEKFVEGSGGYVTADATDLEMTLLVKALLIVVNNYSGIAAVTFRITGIVKGMVF